MNSRSDEAALGAVRDLERRRWRAVIEKDESTLRGQLAEDLIYTHTNSRVESKASFLNAISGGELSYQSVTRSEETEASSESVVVLAGRADIEIIARGVQRSLIIRYSAVWVRRHAGWEFLCWHSTKIPE